MDDHIVGRSLLDEHAAAEMTFDLDAVMETVDADPVFEWHPVGRAAVGRDAVARMYAAFLPRWKHLSETADLRFEVRSEFWNDEARIREQVALVRTPGGELVSHSFVVVVLWGEHGVRGERTYASDEFHRLNLGDHFDDLSPLPHR